MPNRNLICPICKNKDKVYVDKGQKVRRCEKCSRTIRVISAPRARKKKNKKENEQRV